MKSVSDREKDSFKNDIKTHQPLTLQEKHKRDKVKKNRQFLNTPLQFYGQKNWILSFWRPLVWNAFCHCAFSAFAYFQKVLAHRETLIAHLFDVRRPSDAPRPQIISAAAQCGGGASIFYRNAINSFHFNFATISRRREIIGAVSCSAN